MPFKGALVGPSTSRPASPEKGKALKSKKDKAEAQRTWVEKVSKTRESFHIGISLTDFSRPWLGKWNQARRGGNDHIEVVRTKSQAGMLRPRRLPTIYRSNTRLYIDTVDNPVPEIPRRRKSTPETEKQMVIVDLPERVQINLSSISSEKQSVVVGMSDGVEITLSPRTERAAQSSSRFEELKDDASVHELEAVYHTESTPADEDDAQPGTVILCEADDPTALTALEILQRSLTMDLKKARPKISVAIPRSKSLHIISENGTPGTAIFMSPMSPPSTALSRSLTQRPSLRYSVISPITSADLVRTVRPFSTISVPLFMEASDLSDFVDSAEEIPPLPATAAEIAEKYGNQMGLKKQASQKEAPAEEVTMELQESSPQEQSSASSSTPAPSDDAGSEASEDLSTPLTRRLTEKNIAKSMNKPLPPEPQMPLPEPLPPLAYKSKHTKGSRSQEILPRSKYASAHIGRFEELRRLNKTRSTSVDEAMEELEWRLSTICDKRLQKEVRTLPSRLSRGSGTTGTVRASKSPPPPVPQSDGTTETIKASMPLTRSASANHIIEQKRRSYHKERKTRSLQDLSKPATELVDLAIVEESETWYKTASERSSAHLSNSVFSEAGTDGTCPTEQSGDPDAVQSRADSRAESECAAIIKDKELPRAMQSRKVSGDAAEAVLLGIMSNLSSLKDLFATAALNKGFYQTFKRHEMCLIKSALFRSSVPAWELREISEESQLNPTAYLRQYSIEIYTMGMLKSLILVQCESLLRIETVAGLVGTDAVAAAEVDAAFWRVWTFCHRFGTSAGGDENIDLQIDWLNGGRLARKKDPSTTFGIGNGDGLSKEELWDMIEIWTCLSVLVQTFHGRVKEARQAGIYRNCKAATKRDQELLLEEWTSYILTLGPSCILALAPGSFATARELGLADWTAPASGPDCSRSKFCKQTLIRVYEARMVQDPRNRNKAKRSSRASTHRMTKSELTREVDRARQMAFAREIQTLRQDGPSISDAWSFSDERPMSVYSQVVKSMARGGRISAQDLASLPRHASMYSHSSRTTSSRAASTRAASVRSGCTTPRCPQTPILTSFNALPPVNDPDDLPAPTPEIVIEEASSKPKAIPTPTTPTRAPTKRVPATPAKSSKRPKTIPHPTNPQQIVDPTDRALRHLVEILGFDSADAKWALTRSENGHGIDLNRAIEILVSGASAPSAPTPSTSPVPQTPKTPNSNTNTNNETSAASPAFRARARSPPLETTNNRRTPSPQPHSSPGPLSPASSALPSPPPLTTFRPSPQTIRQTEPVEVDSSRPRPQFARKRTPINFSLSFLSSTNHPTSSSSAALTPSRSPSTATTTRNTRRDSIATQAEEDQPSPSEKDRERANMMRMREKSYRVLGIGSGLAGQGNSFGMQGDKGIGGWGGGAGMMGVNGIAVKGDGISGGGLDGKLGGRRFGSLVGKRLSRRA